MANLGKRTRSIRETVKNKENLSVEDGGFGEIKRHGKI